MKKIIFVLLLSNMLMNAWSQQGNFSILGKVIDSTTRQVLNGASAYCQNTTHGTITNNNGLFFMRLPNGGYDLVVSYTGYQKRIMRISNSQSAADTLLIELPKEEKSLSEVAVVGSSEVADGLAKYGQFFLENFIGTTPNAAHCELKNPEALRFFYTKKRNRLRVTAKEDLLIQNNSLGYTIRYQLDSFSFDYNTKVSQFTGYPFFIEKDTTEEVKKIWKVNRARTFLGSRFHFMRALYDSTLADEGFVIEKMDDDPNSVNGKVIGDPYDPEIYEVDSNDVVIHWKGRYRISYKTVYPDKKYLQEYKLPENLRSQVTLLNVADGFVIEENGYFYEQYDVINVGYWAWKKLAELLPYDYEYE